MLEWVIEVIKALVNGKFDGSIQIRFKDGGISSITRPKTRDKIWAEKVKNAILINHTPQ